MCCRQIPRHPACRHAAHGTALQAARSLPCEQALRRGAPCSVVPWSFFDVERGYCDTCILNGERLAQEQGLDPGVYCERMGVGYAALREANLGSDE